MNKSKGSQKNSKRRQLGIRWKMLSIFFVFILFFTLVIWIFQIQMLIYFYHGVKYKELDATLKEIQMVKDDNLQIVEIASRKAKDNYEDIWVYRVEDGVLNEDRPIVFSDGSHDSRAVFLQRKFDDFYSRGLIDKVFTTNLIYQTPELLSREWYCSVNMSKYIALIVDTLNHDNSISSLLDPVDRIKKIVAKYQDK